MKNLSFTLTHERPARLLTMCPAYTASPLLRKDLGGVPFWLKDETDRMGLGSFKALGGVYATARLIIGGADLSHITHEDICSKAAGFTFVCASAGNHGMAVAAGAKLFGAKARIHLSASVPSGFAKRLKDKGAQVVRSGDNYEDSVQAAIRDANDNGSVHLADGSWPRYTEPPRLVMEGYTVMAEEMRQVFAAKQSRETKSVWPTHVFLQAGVGSMAAAIAYMIRKNWAVQPKIIIVEPEHAPCLKESKNSGKVVTVNGSVSIMGRLDCKTASMLAFEILDCAADHFVTISDAGAEMAADALTKNGIPTTPSGAAGYAALMSYGLPIDANPLVIVTEGKIL